MVREARQLETSEKRLLRKDECHFLAFQASNLVKSLDVFQQIGGVVCLSELDLESHSTYKNKFYKSVPLVI